MDRKAEIELNDEEDDVDKKILRSMMKINRFERRFTCRNTQAHRTPNLIKICWPYILIATHK